MNEILLYNPHAGDILKHEFLEELGIHQNTLASAIDVDSNKIHAIIKGKYPVTAEIDLCLCRYFGLSEGYFLRLQNTYEIMEAKRKLGEKLNQINPYSYSQ
ncbi:MAG: addiction module antidote protein, HigA family [Oscillatoriales cyanobacterium CG2_30_40_61]|nr:MAG: addiction module antidote protein, HigA family [Oscillatoriales cyanobacterium CG2_30_40_61]